MRAYGAPIAAVVAVGKGGGTTWQGLPVFDLVEQALAAFNTINTSIVFVPPDQVADATLEAIAAGIRQLVLVPKDVPPLDMLKIIRAARATQTVVLGAGSAGLIVPDRFLLGTLRPQCYRAGRVGLIARTSSELSEAIAWELTQAGLGQSVGVHLGVGNILGSTMTDWLPMLMNNEDTQAIVLLEQHLLGNDTANCHLPTSHAKPVFAYVAGQRLPPPELQPPTGHTLPHSSTAAQKLAYYQAANIRVARSPRQLVKWLRLALKI